MGCSDHHLITLLKSIFASNDTAHQYDRCTGQGINASNLSTLHNNSQHDLSMLLPTGTHKDDIGKNIYAFTSPWIIAIGLVGNLISLCVFTSHQLRKLSASYYLMALSVSDSIVLLTYVLLDWLYRGLPQWPGGYQIPVINLHGMCEIFLFTSYTFRFVSVYLIVIFTIERYIAVCKPLQRRRICTKKFARQIIIGVHLIGALVSLFKPLLSGVYKINRHDQGAMQMTNGSASSFSSLNSTSMAPPDTANILDIPIEYVCSRNINYDEVNFVMDLLYGLSITAVPFAIITIFNLLILSRLVRGDSVSNNLKVQKNRIRLELTVMLLAISTSFILLNLPYFVVWVQQFLQSIDPESPLTAHKIRNSLYITKTIFYLNYAINFFVYCMTGTYYRGFILRKLMCKPRPTQYMVPGQSSPSLHTELREMSILRTIDTKLDR